MAGTIGEVTLQHVASTYVIGETSVNVTVAEIYGWKLNLTGTDLEVDPEGQNLTLELIHEGNGHEIPYFAKAGAGWNITLPNAGDVVEPYGTTSFTVFVQPPENAIAGEVGVMRIRITGDDLNGKIVEEIPLRVGAAPQLEIDHRGHGMSILPEATLLRGLSIKETMLHSSHLMSMDCPMGGPRNKGHRSSLPPVRSRGCRYRWSPQLIGISNVSCSPSTSITPYWEPFLTISKSNIPNYRSPRRLSLTVTLVLNTHPPP